MPRTYSGSHYLVYLLAVIPAIAVTPSVVIAVLAGSAASAPLAYPLPQPAQVEP